MPAPFRSLLSLLAASIAVATPPPAGDTGAPSDDVLLEQASHHLRDGRWELAFENWLQVLNRDASSAAAKRARESADQLASRLMDTPGELTPNEFDALRPTLSKLARHRIYAAAMLMGRRLREGGDAEQAFEVFRAAAVQGYPPAMIQVGLMYSNGDGVKQDMERASYWLRPANVKGDAEGKYLLAECFLYGKGVQTNQSLAVTLLREAVEMERPARAMDLLGTCYHKGWGVEADAEEAVRWYRAGCERGYDQACANLAVLTMLGEGTEQDPPRAWALLEAGAAHGHPASLFFGGLALLEGAGTNPNPDTGRSWIVQAAQAGHDKAQAWCAAHGIDVPDAEVTR